ncbi:type II CAAX endopeptidase family protein [Kocuria sp. KSNUG]|uniref:CPBP family intramembrane glutamic endopeptidase n=1 Tax=Kocuria sp. KSNUG TaxID=3136676 RepID=UPI003C2BAD9E
MTASSADHAPGVQTTPRARTARPAVEGMSEARRPTGPVVAIIVTLLIMGLGQLPVAPLALMLPTTTFGGQLLFTASFLLPMLMFFAWVRFKEKRPVASLGFRGPAGKQILIGAVVGVALTTFTVLVNLLLGTASLGSPTWGMLLPALVLLVGFAIQGSTEEIADRGFLTQAVAPRWGLVAAMIIQTIVFAVLHGANGGLTWVAWGNLCAVAVFLGLWVWVSGNLWGACAFHAFWNWSQGNLWGAPVSHAQVGTSVAHYTPHEGSSALLTGGTFGLEGSVIPLLIFIASSVVLVIVGRRRQASTGRVHAA